MAICNKVNLGQYVSQICWDQTAFKFLCGIGKAKCDNRISQFISYAMWASIITKKQEVDQQSLVVMQVHSAGTMTVEGFDAISFWSMAFHLS